MTVRVAFGGRGNWIGAALGGIIFAMLAATVSSGEEVR